MGYSVGQDWLGAFAFADDLLLISKSPNEMNQMLEEVSSWATQYNLRVNIDKTEFMTK